METSKNKFDLPAYFDRNYYESRYLIHIENGNTAMAKMWEDFYFENAISYAWVNTFEKNKKLIGSKKAGAMADEVKKNLEKEYKHA